MVQQWDTLNNLYSDDDGHVSHVCMNIFFRIWMIVHVYGHKIFTLIKDWLMCVLYRAVGPVFRYWSADLKRIFSNILADCSGISLRRHVLFVRAISVATLR